MLLALWLYALSQAVGSAREIARLVHSDVAYRWIAGNVDVSHQKLSQFRVGYGEALSQLMTNVLATLMHKGCCHLRWWPRMDADSSGGQRVVVSELRFTVAVPGTSQAARQGGAGCGGHPEYTRAQHAARAKAARTIRNAWKPRSRR